MYFDHGTWYNTEGNQFGSHKYFRGMKPSGCGGEKKSVSSFREKKKEVSTALREREMGLFLGMNHFQLRLDKKRNNSSMR